MFDDRPAWHAFAACRGEDPDVWHPGRGVSAAIVPALRAVCRSCEVRADCAGQAVALGQDAMGVWAGMTGGERSRLRRHGEVVVDGERLVYAGGVVTIECTPVLVA